MDIVILADFLGPLDGTFNSRFLYLADMLSKDNEVEVITSDFIHGEKKYIDHDIEKHNYIITMLHEGMYSKNVSLGRFYGHYIWGKNVTRYLINRRKKPDAIYCAIPTLYASYEAARFCERNKIRFVIDVQDLWPEAYKMVFNVPVISSIVFSPFKFLADGIYRRADAICAVSDTYCKRAASVNKRVKETVTVFLGTKLSLFDENVRQNPIKKDKCLWLGYCGSMGDSYDLKVVIDALALLENPPTFIAMGDGQKKDEFERYAKEKSVKCLFTGRLPYDKMCGWLKKCDMVVNPIVGNSAASIINKHADYAASGRPVLNTQNSKEYRNLVEEYNMGFNCESGNATDLAEKIRILVEDEHLRIQLGENARRCAKERFDREKTYIDLMYAITSQD